MRTYLLLLSCLIFSINQVTYTQISSKELDSIGKILEIKKELYFLELESPIELEDLSKTTSYFSYLFNEDSASDRYSINLLYTHADISFYKFVTLGRSEYPWVEIFGVNSSKQLFVLEDEIQFYNDLCNSMNINDSLKLLNISKIYEKIYSNLYDIKIPNSAKELPFYNWLIEEEYFKINRTENAYYYKTYFEEETEESTDTYIMSLILEKGQFRYNKWLYKRVPK